MLSDSSFPVVKATLPVVGEHIHEIATRFYQHMFQEHPELLDGLFNRGNQADGKQQQALAGSVAAFAGFLVNDPTHLPDHLLSRIAHKHVSLGLRPDQYDIVHDNLMWAIVDVLGDAVTPEVAAAWDEVYWLMANMLINKERGLYSAVRLTPDTVWRTWRVAEKIRETDDVITFIVERTDEREVKPSLPGQYVTVKMKMPDGVHQPRQYSLTRADDGHHRHFAVKRVRTEGAPDGEVSSLLHDNVQVGDEITLSAPFGDVVLAKLPDASMATWLLNQEDGGAQGLVHDALGPVHQGFMDVRAVDLPDDAEYYLCGPVAFMQSVRTGAHCCRRPGKGHPVRGLRSGPVAGRLPVGQSPGCPLTSARRGLPLNYVNIGSVACACGEGVCRTSRCGW